MSHILNLQSTGCFHELTRHCSSLGLTIHQFNSKPCNKLSEAFLFSMIRNRFENKTFFTFIKEEASFTRIYHDSTINRVPIDII